MQSLIRFFKEVYLTGYVVIFKMGRVKDLAFRAGGAIGIVTLIEWLFLIGISDCIEMFFKTKFILSKPAVYLTLFALFLINEYILFLRGHGTKFEREFDSLSKSRKSLLVTSCVVMLVVIVAFSFGSMIAYRHFIGAH